MINANELRIGNYYKVGNRFDMVESITKYGINISSGYEGAIESEYDHESIEPIPLTDKILDQVPKEFTGLFGVVRTNGSFIFIRKEEDLKAVTLPNTDFVLHINFFNGLIKNYYGHVHQLQNLYFALTGKELTINL